MPREAKTKPVAAQTAAKVLDDGRWQEYVRLTCVEIAAMRAASVKNVFDADQLIPLAKALASFVHKGS